MSTTETEIHTRSRGWTPAVIPVALLLMALGAWVFLAPLVGPYFSFGFDTTTHWRFSNDHWTLSLLPGIAIFAGGLLMVMPSRFSGWLAGLLAVAGGVWLVIGPTLHAVWSSNPVEPLPGSDWKTALRWIGDFYGAGALAIYLGAQAQGLLERTTETVVERRPAADDTIGERRPAADDGTVVERRVGDDDTVIRRPVAAEPTRTTERS